jgi:hypothetical protein
MMYLLVLLFKFAACFAALWILIGLVSVAFCYIQDFTTMKQMPFVFVLWQIFFIPALLIASGLAYISKDLGRIFYELIQHLIFATCSPREHFPALVDYIKYLYKTEIKTSVRSGVLMIQYSRAGIKGKCHPASDEVQKKFQESRYIEQIELLELVEQGKLK